MEKDKTVEIYVPLLEEGTPTLKGTQAIPLGDNLYKVLPAEGYNPEDEIWEFLPGSIVRCKIIESALSGKKILCAYEVQNSDGTFTISTEAS